MQKFSIFAGWFAAAGPHCSAAVYRAAAADLQPLLFAVRSDEAAAKLALLVVFVWLDLERPTSPIATSPIAMPIWSIPVVVWLVLVFIWLMSV